MPREQFVHHGAAWDSAAAATRCAWADCLLRMDALPAALTTAGGIGGLLAMTITDPSLENPPDPPAAPPGPPATTRNFGVLCDAMGNVVQLGDPDANSSWTAIAGQYEYDVYGNPIGPDADGDGSFFEPNDLSPTARANRVRFSSKPFDAETGLGSWLYRYYSPKVGRWVSRDPIGEEGGVALYVAVENAPSANLDAYGDFVIPPLVEAGASAASLAATKCLSCGLGAAEAGREIAEEVTVELSRTGSATLERDDALQHCIGSCVVASQCGTTCAAFLGSAKEWRDFLRGGQDTHCEDGKDGSRDSFNNRIGRSCRAVAQSDCAPCCVSRLQRGELWVEGENDPVSAENARRSRIGRLSCEEERQIRFVCRRRYGGLE